MNKLDSCIKSYNLMYTNTLDRDSLKSGIDENDIEVNYDNCISLYNLIASFNKMHKEFLKEYKELEKFDLGKEIDIKGFSKYNDTPGYNYRVLDIYIQNPNEIDDSYAYLYMREINGVSMPFISNERGSILDDSGYYRKFIKLNAKKVRKYLNLFEKYQLLLNLYQYLRNQVVYGDGKYLLFTRIDSENNRFLDTMDSFRVTLSSTHGSIINIKVNLGDELKVDLDNSRVNLDGEDIELNNDNSLNILKRIYVNGKFLKKQKKSQKENNKVKKLNNHI